MKETFSESCFHSTAHSFCEEQCGVTST